MPPRDFSQDGAAGAGGGGGGAIGPDIMHDPGPGTSIGPQIMHDPGPSSAGGGFGPMASPSTSSRTPSALPAGSVIGGGLGPLAPQDTTGGIGAQDTTGGIGRQPIGGGYGPVASSPSPVHGAGGLPSSPIGLSFSRGGAVDDTDGDPAQDAVARALDTVDGVLAFGRKLHGLGGEGSDGSQQMAMNTDGFNQSGNIEDRRDNDPTQGQPLPSNQQTNFDRVAGKVSDMQASRNPTSQALGINNLAPIPTPYPGDGGGAPGGAIDLSDEENQ